MDTTELRSAYRQLLTVAETITDETPLRVDLRMMVDWLVAHVAITEHVLAGAARDVLTGVPAVIDNYEAMHTGVISSIVDLTSHDRRVADLRDNAADLVASVATIPPHAETAPVLLRFADRGGRSIPDQRLPWCELVHAHAGSVLPSHTRTLAFAFAQRCDGQLPARALPEQRTRAGVRRSTWR
ncbi:MAG TPA: hypothetical protein VFW65_16285 [Pseudonocardiaceae bacterium]|nr:hypothetical protein [Pseudonocardiaceae bacterium]